MGKESENRPAATQKMSVQPLDDPDFINAQKALNRAAEKAIARARQANLEPVVMPDDSSSPTGFNLRDEV